MILPTYALQLGSLLPTLVSVSPALFSLLCGWMSGLPTESLTLFAVLIDYTNTNKPVAADYNYMRRR